MVTLAGLSDAAQPTETTALLLEAVVLLLDAVVELELAAVLELELAAVVELELAVVLDEEVAPPFAEPLLDVVVAGVPLLEPVVARVELVPWPPPLPLEPPSQAMGAEATQTAAKIPSPFTPCLSITRPPRTCRAPYDILGFKESAVQEVDTSPAAREHRVGGAERLGGQP
jgi:hypothetical protein